jgi:chlorophyllide a reductase subunit Y
VPTASGVPLQLLPKEINGVRIIGIDVPGFGVPTHAEAKDVLAGAMLRYARAEAEAGPVAAPRTGRGDKPTVTLLGEMFPADPVGIGMMLEPMGLAAGPVVPTREWRELYAALDGSVVAAIHPFYTAAIREFQAAGRKIVVGSAPVGRDGTEAWLQADRAAAERRPGADRRRQEQWLPVIAGALAKMPIKGASRCRATKARSCWSADCWSRAAPTCATWAPPARARPGATPTGEWLEARGVHVQYRASLEQDLAAVA